MKRLYTFALLGACCLSFAAFGREAKLVRYPHYHQGRIVFTYLGDIWTADENGQNIKRLTVHRARDVYPRFSPDGKWIAFSSDRNGNLDVFIIPAEGGTAKQLTFHSADDTVLGWTPDGRAVLFASQRGEDFMGKLYTVSVDDRKERNAGPDMGVYATFSPDGKKLAINRKSQVYWRKYYRGSYQTDVTVMDIAAKKFTDLTDFDGMDSWPMWSRDGNIYFVSDREGNGLTNIWRVREKGGKAEQVTSFKTGDVRCPGDERRRQDDRLRARLRHLEAGRGQPQGRADQARHRRRDAGEPGRDRATSTRRWTITTSRLRAAASCSQSTASSSPRRPTKATCARSPTAPGATRSRSIRPTASRSPSSPTAAAAKRFTSSRPMARANRRRSPTSTRSNPVSPGRPIRKRSPSPPPTASCARYTLATKQTAELDFVALRQHQRAGLVARRQVDRLLEGGCTRAPPTFT